MAFLSYNTDALAENRHWLIVDVHTTSATGAAEREVALVMGKRSVEQASGARKPTVAADRGYDTAEFVGAPTALGIAPHVVMPRPKAAPCPSTSRPRKVAASVCVVER